MRPEAIPDPVSRNTPISRPWPDRRTRKERIETKGVVMKLLNGINDESSARTGHYGNVARHLFRDEP